MEEEEEEEEHAEEYYDEEYDYYSQQRRRYSIADDTHNTDSSVGYPCRSSGRETTVCSELASGIRFAAVRP